MILTEHPIELFKDWFEAAKNQYDPCLDALTLATITPEGLPAARIVLIKDFSVEGFCFFTNYKSHKARDLDAHPVASMVFYWPSLAKQVRITGKVGRVSRTESENYFRTRPRGSQVGAWASEQSSEIPSREFLIQKSQEIENQYSGQEVPCPPFWGGYRLQPQEIEFWIGKDNRLHDRFFYRLQPDQTWTVSQLSP